MIETCDRLSSSNIEIAEHLNIFSLIDEFVTLKMNSNRYLMIVPDASNNLNIYSR